MLQSKIMSEQKLTAEGEFLVKESKFINYIMGGVLIAVFFIIMMFKDEGWSNYIFAIGVFLVPGAIAIAKGRNHVTIIRINKTGFYYTGKLVSDWKQFHDAEFREKLAVGSYKDNFVLDFRYYSDDRMWIYTKSIPLTNTQDKAEEEIIDAIQFYCNVGRGMTVEEKNGTNS